MHSCNVHFFSSQFVVRLTASLKTLAIYPPPPPPPPKKKIWFLYILLCDHVRKQKQLIFISFKLHHMTII